MDVRIEPEDWDVIVVGSGLPECLIASAVAKAGTSVLVIDQEDAYGSEYASFTVDALLLASKDGPESASLIGKATTAAPTEAAGMQQHDSSGPHSAHATSVVHVPLPTFHLPLHDIEALGSHGQDIGNKQRYILDLMPKLIYQAEGLVDLLVKTGAHHYMEFKQVEGSYILRPQLPSKAQPAASVVASQAASNPSTSTSTSSAAQHGVLWAVPSSKSDIFKDRTLGLAEKRSLMTFISSAVEATQGSGRLKDVMGSEEPLVEVLGREGVTQHLQEVIMYGIAMCETQQTSSNRSSSAQCTAAATQAHMSAAEGAAALKLFMESNGRFGTDGAFMLPCYGCGSIPEAFVRCCAVSGATTVLRQCVTAAVVGGLAGGQRCVQGVVTSGGQVLRCNKLVMGPSRARALVQEAGCSGPSRGHAEASAASLVSRALVIMDGPLVPDKANLTVVIPPASPVLQGSNAHAIRGVQLSPSLATSPSNRYLLYLSTPSSKVAAAPGGSSTLSCAARADLEAAVRTLVGGLAELRPLWQQQEQEQEQEGSPAGGPAAGSAGQAADSADAGSEGGQEQHTADTRPQAVQVFFYQQQSHTHPHENELPVNLVCPAPPACQSVMGLVGHGPAVSATEAVFRKHFPDLPWLSEITTSRNDDDSEDDAVDQLEAALGQLMAEVQPAAEVAAGGAGQQGAHAAEVHTGGARQQPGNHGAKA